MAKFTMLISILTSDSVLIVVSPENYVCKQFK